ncbi:hypothetical protein OSTOST_06480 [Ostertagia ostertagi]
MEFIAPDTFASRCFTMLYGALFCPITWIIIRDIGQLALVYLTTVYARLKLRFTNAGEKADQVFMVPISICLGICILIMLFAPYGCTPTMHQMIIPFIYHYEVIRIGLGDVMPNNIPVINRMSFLEEMKTSTRQVPIPRRSKLMTWPPNEVPQ